jgi:hypothetical protein
MESGMNTPDKEISSKIIAEFKKESLLSSVQLEKLNKCLANGEITSEDWYLFFESDLLEKNTTK